LLRFGAIPHCCRRRGAIAHAKNARIIGEDLVADLHTLSADEHRWTGYELANVLLRLIAEGAGKHLRRIRCVGSLRLLQHVGPADRMPLSRERARQVFGITSSRFNRWPADAAG
jgi:hypothetical protein